MSIDESKIEPGDSAAADTQQTPSQSPGLVETVEFSEDPDPAKATEDENHGNATVPGHCVEAGETPALPEDEPDDEPDDEPEDVEEPAEVEATLETVIEAVLFASDEQLSPKRLVEIAEAGSVKDVKAAIKSLNRKYRQSNHSFRIEKISGGFQMMTLSAYNPWISKLIKVRSDNKLSPAALETLAIVSYKQPIIRADVEAIRGVAAGEVLRSLMFKGLVKIVGRAEILGRPMLYGTTKKFLDVFGLASLKDLPKIEELKNPEKG
ncbi:MAG: SMC-Scp complex subunit ScpB [Planctomycetaceae bacterium]|nr:SMC-Scp complex subunit ScpB [Planctomycetaceae bacterium]